MKTKYPTREEMATMSMHVLAHQIAKQHVLVEFLEHSLSKAKYQLEEWQKEMNDIRDSLSETKTGETE